MEPTQFGPYRVVRRLGRGGMGAVFEAVDPATGSAVAIKTLPGHLQDEPLLRARLTAEIEALKGLRHPGIARLLAYGEQDGVPFFAMELVRGRTLDDILRSGHRFPWREAVLVAGEVAKALKAAHDQGVVHRDLKPANLLFAPADGGGFVVKVADFGIAKLFGESPQTQAGFVVGTPEYMAPEQIAGGPIDQRADVYALGLVLFAMLTGAPPFRDASVANVLEHHRSRRPPPIASLVADVPRELDELVAALLEKDPGDRPANAAVVARQLAAIATAAAGARVAARPAPDQAAPTQPLPAVPPTIPGVAATPEPPARTPRTSFTSVEDAARERRAREKRQTRWRTTLGTLGALVIVAAVGGVAWKVLDDILWPSAAERYDTIVEVANNPDDPRDPCPLIRAFLAGHADHPSAGAVRMLGRRIAVERLEKRSRRRPASYVPRSAVERKYLEALAIAAPAPAECLAMLEAIIRDHNADAPGSAARHASDPCAAADDPDDGLWLDLVRRQIEAVSPQARSVVGAERRREGDEVARAKTMVKRAQAYAQEAATTSDAARKVAAITLRHELLEQVVAEFGSKPHAAEVVGEARRLLAESE